MCIRANVVGNVWMLRVGIYDCDAFVMQEGRPDVPADFGTCGP